jgi:Protein of unknown function (DUF559)
MCKVAQVSGQVGDESDGQAESSIAPVSATELVLFLTDDLPRLNHASRLTILAYRDALKLGIPAKCADHGTVDYLTLDEVDAILQTRLTQLGLLRLLTTEAVIGDVEVDGAQHLADPAAYRRDRRKDQLLQENGYLVLRFLAEDFAKELDSVLDDILRVLSSRRVEKSYERGLAGRRDRLVRRGSR